MSELPPQLVLDPVGDLLGDGAVGIAGEQPIEVALVDRRGTQTRHRGWKVGRRQDHQLALDVLGLERTDQVAEPDLALPFVAMGAGLHDDARARAVLDAHDRDRNPAIGRAVDRMGHAHEAGRLAFAI